MAKTLTYTGIRGPATITCGGIPFTAGKPRVVEDDAVADQLLAKGCFVEDKPKPATKAARTEE